MATNRIQQFLKQSSSEQSSAKGSAKGDDCGRCLNCLFRAIVEGASSWLESLRGEGESSNNAKDSLGLSMGGTPSSPELSMLHFKLTLPLSGISLVTQLMMGAISQLSNSDLPKAQRVMEILEGIDIKLLTMLVLLEAQMTKHVLKQSSDPEELSRAEQLEDHLDAILGSAVTELLEHEPWMPADEGRDQKANALKKFLDDPFEVFSLLSGAPQVLSQRDQIGLLHTVNELAMGAVLKRHGGSSNLGLEDLFGG